MGRHGGNKATPKNPKAAVKSRLQLYFDSSRQPTPTGRHNNAPDERHQRAVAYSSTDELFGRRSRGCGRFTNIRIIGFPERQPVENNELVSMGSGMDRGDLLIYSTICHRTQESN